MRFIEVPADSKHGEDCRRQGWILVKDTTKVGEGSVTIFCGDDRVQALELLRLLNLGASVERAATYAGNRPRLDEAVV